MEEVTNEKNNIFKLMRELDGGKSMGQAWR